MSHEETVRKVYDHNIADVMKRGPGLRYTTKTVILARDPIRKEVLVGGLGCMGVGWMWCNENESDKTAAGYDTAPLVDSETGLPYPDSQK